MRFGLLQSPLPYLLRKHRIHANVLLFGTLYHYNPENIINIKLIRVYWPEAKKNLHKHKPTKYCCEITSKYDASSQKCNTLDKNGIISLYISKKAMQNPSTRLICTTIHWMQCGDVDIKLNKLLEEKKSIYTLAVACFI